MRLGSQMKPAMRASAIGHAEFPIWGGKAIVSASERSGLAAALTQVKRTLGAFDVACSSFREDSELAVLNASAGEPVVVSGLLFAAIREAVRAARLTGGAVDPTVGQALIAHGINPPMNDRPVRIESVPGYEAIGLDDAEHRIRVAVGVRLDLGATAKALAADMAALAASSAAGCGVLVGLCGDIAVAGDPPEEGWTVRVTDDHRHGERAGQTVAIRTGGLATSSVTVRRGAHMGEAVHHLIDPATGQPAGGPWRTVSVTAPSCADANTASTAAIVMGNSARAWLEQHAFPARLVGHDGSVYYTSGWPQTGDEL